MSILFDGAGMVSLDTISAMTPEMVLDFMGLRLNGPKANGKTIAINWIIPETGTNYHIELENSVLIYSEQKTSLPKAELTLTLPKLAFLGILAGRTSLDKEQQAGHAKVEGNAQAFNDLLGLLDSFEPMFNIVTP